MAINVDKVYKQVLAIMNKEGRGYLPSPEFNVLAHKAQMEIFDNTFHDYKMALRKPKNNSKLGDELDMIREKLSEFRYYDRTITKSTDGSLATISSNAHWLENVYEGNSYRSVDITFPAKSDIDDDAIISLRAKYDGTGGISANEAFFRVYLNKSGGIADSEFSTGRIVVNLSASNITTAAQVADAFRDMINTTSPYHSAIVSGSTVTLKYKQEGIQGSDDGIFETTSDNSITFSNVSAVKTHVTYEEVDAQDWIYITSGGSKLKPTSNRPVFYRKNKTTIGVYPSLTTDIKHDYIARPSSPTWVGYENQGRWVFNSGASANFTLHNSEESTLVNKILELAGVSLNKLEVTQAAIRSEQINEADKNN